MLSLSGAYVGISWTRVERVLGLCWPILGLPGTILAHLGAMLGVFCTIYVHILIRCEFLRPGPLSEVKAA